MLVKLCVSESKGIGGATVHQSNRVNFGVHFWGEIVL